jgi:hypothetical protein
LAGGYGGYDTIGGGGLGLDMFNALADGSNPMSASGSSDTVGGVGGAPGSGNTPPASPSETTIGAGSGPASDNDTVVGFSVVGGFPQPNGNDAAPPTVASSQLVNGAQDTLITMSDGSTLLIKGIGTMGWNPFA